MNLLNLTHSSSFPIGRYSEALGREKINPQPVNALSEMQAEGKKLNVILLDSELAANGHHQFPVDSRTAIVGVGLDSSPTWLGEGDVLLHIPSDPEPKVLLAGIRTAYQFIFQKVRNEQLEELLSVRSRELEEINEVGIALSTVRDHNVLLTTILSKSRQLSRSDAGSLYLLDEIPGQGKVLRWKLAQNDSIEVDFEEKVLPITKKSLAGYVALTGETLVIDDAYELPKDVEYSINRSFDVENGYLTRSMIIFPMMNHRGDIIGVLQLINRKRATTRGKLTAGMVPAEVIHFDDHTIDVMSSLAGQAAVAFENNILYDSIERLFEGFVTAAVTAIEQRDPTTSGHSFRVADLTVELAKTLDRVDDGLFKEVRFTEDQIREIRYASLLHDFGKVGVREQVLVKEKKLYPMHLGSIQSRFDFITRSLEAEHYKKKLEIITTEGLERYAALTPELDEQLEEALTKLREEYDFIVQSNEPTVLPEGNFQQLQLLSQREYEDLSGQTRTLLTPEEARILSIRKGNLDSVERVEIESHVTHTFHFLSKIPWTKDLIGVPNIAYAHHEKLNGKGYPRGLPGEQIPLQARMMSISDIYDALTAKDRPYKKAVPTDRALDILRMEVKDGFLDPSVVDIFIEAKIYEKAGILRSSS